MIVNEAESKADSFDKSLASMEDSSGYFIFFKYKIRPLKSQLKY